MGVDSMRYFARVGLDGTLKYKHGVSLRDMPINHYFEGFKVFGESPLEYVVWGINATQVNPEFTRTFDLYILDSLFMPQQRFTLNDNNAYEGDYHYGYGLQDKVLRLDDGTFVTATQYKKWSSGFPNVTAITKFDRNTFEFVKQIRFATKPYSEHFGCANPIGIEKAKDGGLYFAYNTQDPLGPIGLVSVVKLDKDLNIIWQRFCLEPYFFTKHGNQMIALDGGGVAVGGVYFGTPPTLFFLSFDEEGVGTHEMESFIRPYSLYPNPTQGELRMQCSPDAEPSQIEFHDLQGRLVHSQRGSLQSLNISQLPAGIYTMRVTMKDGTTFVDKVVKE